MVATIHMEGNQMKMFLNNKKHFRTGVKLRVPISESKIENAGAHKLREAITNLFMPYNSEPV